MWGATWSWEHWFLFDSSKQNYGKINCKWKIERDICSYHRSSYPAIHSTDSWVKSEISEVAKRSTNPHSETTWKSSISDTTEVLLIVINIILYISKALIDERLRGLFFLILLILLWRMLFLGYFFIIFSIYNFERALMNMLWCLMRLFEFSSLFLQRNSKRTFFIHTLLI